MKNCSHFEYWSTTTQSTQHGTNSLTRTDNAPKSLVHEVSVYAYAIFVLLVSFVPLVIQHAQSLR